MGPVDDFEAFGLVLEVDRGQKRVVQVELLGFPFEQLSEPARRFDVWDEQRPPQAPKVGDDSVGIRRADAVCHCVGHAAWLVWLADL